MPVTPCDDGCFIATLRRDYIPPGGAAVDIAMRAVGERLPPLEIPLGLQRLP